MRTRHRTLPTLLLVAAVMTATPACAAQYGSYRGASGPRWGGAQAYDVGYREGFEHGRDDGRQGRPFDYSRHGDYRSADLGYRGGSRSAYRQDFRQGFVTGYNDAYRQFGRSRPGRDGRIYRDGPPYGRPGGGYGRLQTRAADQGYRDGYAQGRDDARDGDRYDPIRAKRYREGDHDYDRRDGSRDDYKREYRAAFEQGYAQGYREARRR
ncbi:MAG: hypothetical protein AB7I13_18930 [Vicinamibacterales bacterium]